MYTCTHVCLYTQHNTISLYSDTVVYNSVYTAILYYYMQPDTSSLMIYIYICIYIYIYLFIHTMYYTHVLYLYKCYVYVYNVYT